MKAMVRMIGVVTNPRAGKTIGNPARINRLKQILGQNGFLREAQTFDEMLDIAEEFGGEGITVLAIHGGDGTLHHALSAFIPAYAGADLPPVSPPERGYHEYDRPLPRDQGTFGGHPQKMNRDVRAEIA